MGYYTQLEDDRWKIKRQEILHRDRYKCRKCGCKYSLQVHHKIYVKGRKPWEYTNQFLVTLCGRCHLKEHQGKETKDFVSTDKKIIKHSNPNKNHKDSKRNKYKSNRSNTSWWDYIK